MPPPAGGKHMTTQQRLAMVRQVKLSREDLLGNFSATRNRQTRAAAWRAINDFARANGFPCACPEEKAPNIFFWWRNETTAAKKRADQLNATGGGLEAGETGLTDVQSAVLEVLGKQSPVVIGIKESAAAAKSQKRDQEPEENDENVEVLNQSDGEPALSLTPPPTKKSRRSIQDEKDEWKARLIKVCFKFEANARCAELDGYKKERELGLRTTMFPEVEEEVQRAEADELARQQQADAEASDQHLMEMVAFE